LGTVLLSIALLNSMLALKAEARLDPFNLAILATGGVLLASGLLARRCARGKKEQGRPT